MPDAPSPPPKAHVAHLMHGRLRLRVPGIRNHPEHMDRMRHRLCGHHGVRDVQVDPRTGSVLVLGDIALEALRHIGREEGLFELIPPEDLKPLAETMMGWLEAADFRLRDVSGGRFGLMSVTAAALIGIAAVQIARGRVNVPALTLLWYAFSAVLMARSSEKLLLT